MTDASKPRLLWLCPDVLHPLNKGGRLRSLHVLQHLKEQFEITFVGLNQSTPTNKPQDFNQYCQHFYAFDATDASKGSASLLAKIKNLIQSVFAGLPYSAMRARQAHKREFISQLLALGRFDLVVCDFPQEAVNLPASMSVPLVLFAHNVEAQLWQRRASNEQRAWLRWVAALQAKQMLRLEASVCKRAKQVICVSQADAQLLAQQHGIEHTAAIPTSVDLDYFRRPEGQPSAWHNGPNLVFTGSMDWQPNLEGIAWFLQACWPGIQQQVPEAKLTVVGRHAPAWLLALAQKDLHITVTGEVPDVRPYLQQARCSIVPLLTGGGTRMKIYESLAFGTPVVSTPLGAEGLPLKPGEDLLLDETPQAMVAAVVSLLQDTNKTQSLAEQGMATVRSSFGAQAVAQAFADLCSACLNQAPPKTQ